MKKSIAAALMLLSAALLAQADEFPEGATAPNAQELRQFLDSKVFTNQYANGVSVRYDFRSNGYFFANISTGANLSGKWSVKDGQICTEIRGADQCSEVRMHKSVLILKRANGEIVSFAPA